MSPGVVVCSVLREHGNARLITGHFKCGSELETGLIVVVVLHVIHGTSVAFSEAIAEILASAFVDGRVLVYVVVIGVSVTVFVEVVARGFDALLISAALRIAVFRGRLVPSVMIVILKDAGC